MQIEKLIEITSLILTAPTIVGALAVVAIWGKAAFRKSDSRDWIMLGVVVSFIGQALDNGYWGIAWTSEFLEHWTAPHWFQWGALANIPSRQIAGTLAAYCHLRAFCEITENPKKTHARIVLGGLAATVVGILGAMVLSSMTEAQ